LQSTNEAKVDRKELVSKRQESRGDLMARIVRIHEYGDASVLKIENLDVPPPGADEAQPIQALAEHWAKEYD
jgi:hypothetical protein